MFTIPYNPPCEIYVDLLLVGGKTKSAFPASGHEVRWPGVGLLGVRVKKTLGMTGTSPGEWDIKLSSDRTVGKNLSLNHY